MAYSDSTVGDLTRFAPTLRSRLLSYHFPDYPVEDLVQDTFVEAYQTIRNRGPPEKVLPWLLTIAERTAQRQCRHQRVRHHDYLIDVIDETAVEPVATLIALEEKDRLRVSLDQLSTRAQALVKAFYTDGLCCREIAKRYDTSGDATKVHLYRARRTLRNLLDRGGDT